MQSCPKPFIHRKGGIYAFKQKCNGTEHFDQVGNERGSTRHSGGQNLHRSILEWHLIGNFKEQELAGWANHFLEEQFTCLEHPRILPAHSQRFCPPPDCTESGDCCSALLNSKDARSVYNLPKPALTPYRNCFGQRNEGIIRKGFQLMQGDLNPRLPRIVNFASQDSCEHQIC